MDDNLFNIMQGDGERLIFPKRDAWSNVWDDWSYRWHRSLHIDDNNCVISLGFPKFMNINEGKDRYCVSENSIRSVAGKGLKATFKIDGSLLIRFVFNGQVCFRTRGSLRVGVDNAYEIDDFLKQYPKLADVNFCSDISLLFEWVSPANQIVIKYPEPALILIGAVIFFRNVHYIEAFPKLMKLERLEGISKELNIPLVEYYDLNNEKEIDDLLEILKNDKKIEGFVLRFNNEQELVKLKTEHYFILHALKSDLTSAKLVELWLSWNKPSYSEFREKFEQQYDFETWLWSMPVISCMFDGIKEAQKVISHVQKFVNENKELNRKEFAIKCQSRFNQLRLSLCFLLRDEKTIPDIIWQKIILQNSKQVEKTMFED